MGDRHRDARQADAERGVAAGVDDPQPDAPAGLVVDDPRIGGHPTVDDEIRVADVTAVVAQRGARCDTRSAGFHLLHPGPAQLLEHLFRIGAGSVEPVVEDDRELVVVVGAVRGILDDQRRIQPAVQLGAEMGMRPVGSGVGDGELVVERPPGLDRLLGQHRNAVHRVRDGQTVPVDGGVLRQLVGQLDPHRLTAGQPDLPGRYLPVPRPGSHHHTRAEVDVGLGGRHRDVDGGTGGPCAGGQQRAGSEGPDRPRPQETAPVQRHPISEAGSLCAGRDSRWRRGHPNKIES